MSRDQSSGPDGVRIEPLEQRLLLSGIQYWEPQYIDPLPGDSQTYAVDFNNVGQVLAVSENDQGDGRIMFWQDGQQTDLTPLVPEADVAYGLPQVCAVNDAGEVAGTWGGIGGPGTREAEPVRVEFFADMIESIRRIDLDTQRSTERIEGVCIVAPVEYGVAGQTELFINLLPAFGLIFLISTSGMHYS